MISMCFPFPNITGLISEQPIIYVRYNELEEFYVKIRFQCEHHTEEDTLNDTRSMCFRLASHIDTDNIFFPNY